HHASGIPRCEFDILNDAVSFVLRVEFAERDAGDELVGPDRAEGGAPICRRSADDGDPGDSCFGRQCRPKKQSACAYEQELAQPVCPAKCTWLAFHKSLPLASVVYVSCRDGITMQSLPLCDHQW